MLNFSSEPNRRNATFNQFSTTFRRIFNPFIAKKNKTKDLDKNTSNHSKSKLIEEYKIDSKIYPTDHPIDILNLNNSLLIKECPICLLPLPLNTKSLECGHVSCDDCLIQYLKTEISESRVLVSCPECSVHLHPNRILELLSNDLYFLNKYEEFSIRKVLITDPETRWCPSPDCGYAVIASSNCEQCPLIECKKCNTFFCYNCQKKCTADHKCKKLKATSTKVKSTRKLNKKSKSNKLSKDKSTEIIDNDSTDNKKTDISTENLTTNNSEISTEEFLNRFNMKQCPSCKILIIKIEDGSCNHVTCGLCGCQFCWLCIKKTSELHYLSPTGCTFFGRKQWSKRKKLFWQFGMLFGAPIFICLSAAIAVPSILIGIPVYFGKKLSNKLSSKKLGKFKKCLFVTSGVISSALIAPVLACGAIAVGVPFLLAYVYGVVPITLCRSKAQENSSKEEPMKLNLSEEETQTFLKQLRLNNETNNQVKEKNKKSKNKSRKDKETDKYKLIKIDKSISNSFESIPTLKDNESTNIEKKSSLDNVDSKEIINSKLDDDLKIVDIQIHCEQNGKKIFNSNKKSIKKLEVKSLENLNISNYCEICEVEHLPCCPLSSSRIMKK